MLPGSSRRAAHAQLQRCVVRCDVSERCGSGSGEGHEAPTDAHRSSSRALQLKRLRRVSFSLQDFVFCVWCFFISGRRRNRRRLAGASFVATTRHIGLGPASPRPYLRFRRGWQNLVTGGWLRFAAQAPQSPTSASVHWAQRCTNAPSASPLCAPLTLPWHVPQEIDAQMPLEDPQEVAVLDEREGQEIKSEHDPLTKFSILESVSSSEPDTSTD